MGFRFLPYSLPTIFILTFVSLFMAGVLLSACDSETSEDTLAGTYDLVSMQIEGEDVAIPSEISGGQLTLDADGAWDGFFVLAMDPGDFPTTIRAEGDYDVSDETVRFFIEDVNYEAETEDIAQITGEVNGDRLSIEMEKIGDEEGHSAVVERD